MQVSFGLAEFVLFIFLVPLALIGTYYLTRAAWRKFTTWAARSGLSKERQKAKARLILEKRIADQRQEAMLKGATEVASTLVQTVVECHLRHLAIRETEHRQQELQMALLLSRQSNTPQTLVGQCTPAPVQRKEALTLVPSTASANRD